MSLLLRNVRPIGADNARPRGGWSTAERPVDVLLKHGIVAGVGADLVGSAELDLGGRFLLPGLWDQHAHVTQTALARHRVDVSSAASALDAASLIGAAINAPTGLRTDAYQTGAEPVVGFGFRDGLWPDEPTAALLDRVSGGVPVVVVSGDLHCCWLNTAALARFAPGASGAVLRETDAFPVSQAVSRVDQDVLDRWVGEVLADAAARGVVGVVDFEMADNLGDWTRRFEAGIDAVRIAAGVYPDRIDSAIAARLRTGDVVGTAGRLTVGPLKVITDGSLNTRTAYCSDPYPGLAGDDARGMLTVPTSELTALLARAGEAGFTAAVHAIGDEANRLALDAFAAAAVGGRIEHAQLVHESDLARFAELGVAASVQPEHAMDDRDLADREWPGRTDRAFMLRSLLDAGAELLFGSDAPVAPLDPWVTIAAAVTRARDERAPWHPEQAITLGEALAASTNGCRGIRVGDVADLAVLDENPFEGDPALLRSMPVAATFVGGYVTYSSL